MRTLRYYNMTCVRLAETRPNVAPEAMVTICRERNIHAMATSLLEKHRGNRPKNTILIGQSEEKVVELFLVTK